MNGAPICSDSSRNLMQELCIFISLQVALSMVFVWDHVRTAKGIVKYAEINKYVFLPNNYRIVDPTFPIPKLDFIVKPTCEKIFEDWIEIAERPTPEFPPRVLEKSSKNAFLLNGYSVLYDYDYHNDTAPLPESFLWSKINELMKMPRMEMIGYNYQGLSVLHASRDYPLTNMTGLVIGSETPWIEVQALHSGATLVYTVEYRRIHVMNTTKVKYIHPVHLAKQWKHYSESFDFAISFSSIEHSGLGSIDPIGDLREVLKNMCLLKKGGLLFVAFPRGQDALRYNAHRIYGRIRTAMVMTGYEWLATYRGKISEPIHPSWESFEVGNVHKQDLFVLKKL